MRAPPPLRCALRPSRVGRALVLVACVSSAGLLASIPLPPIGYLGASTVVLATLWSGLRRTCGQGVPAAIEVGLDRRIVVEARVGGSRRGRILDDSYVGASFTTIVWREDGAQWWRLGSAIVVLPDMLGRDEFRRLRVALRYGRAVDPEGSSDLEAG